MSAVTIDAAKCQACEDCVGACPTELISMVEVGGKTVAQYTGDPDDCIACYSCESACNEGAVVINEN